MQTTLKLKSANQTYEFGVEFTDEEVENLVSFAVYELIDRGAFIPQIPPDIKSKMEDDLKNLHENEQMSAILDEEFYNA